MKYSFGSIHLSIELDPEPLGAGYADVPRLDGVVRVGVGALLHERLRHRLDPLRVRRSVLQLSHATNYIISQLSNDIINYKCFTHSSSSISPTAGDAEPSAAKELERISLDRSRHRPEKRRTI